MKDKEKQIQEIAQIICGRSKDDRKVEKMLDWFELQMTRNDIMLV